MNGTVRTGVLLTLLVGAAPVLVADWNVKGNAGTNPNTDFVGTLDNVPLKLKANGKEAVVIRPDGTVQVGVGPGSGQTDQLVVNGPASGDGVFAQGGRNGVFGKTGHPGASGVYGENTGKGHGVGGRSQGGVGVMGEGGGAACMGQPRVTAAVSMG